MNVADVIRKRQRRFLRLVAEYARWWFKMRMLPPRHRGHVVRIEDGDSSSAWWSGRPTKNDTKRYQPARLKLVRRRGHSPHGEDDPGFEDIVRAYEDGW